MLLYIPAVLIARKVTSIILQCNTSYCKIFGFDPCKTCKTRELYLLMTSESTCRFYMNKIRQKIKLRQLFALKYGTKLEQSNQIGIHLYIILEYVPSSNMFCVDIV